MAEVVSFYLLVYMFVGWLFGLSLCLYWTSWQTDLTYRPKIWYIHSTRLYLKSFFFLKKFFWEPIASKNCRTSPRLAGYNNLFMHYVKTWLLGFCHFSRIFFWHFEWEKQKIRLWFQTRGPWNKLYANFNQFRSMNSQKLNWQVFPPVLHGLKVTYGWTGSVMSSDVYMYKKIQF